MQEVLKMPQCSGHLISSAAARHKNESHPTVSGRSILSWSKRVKPAMLSRVEEEEEEWRWSW